MYLFFYLRKRSHNETLREVRCKMDSCVKTRLKKEKDKMRLTNDSVFVDLKTESEEMIS